MKKWFLSLVVSEWTPVAFLWLLFVWLQSLYVTNPHAFTYDEGSYWLTLRVMSTGEKLYLSIFCSQFPAFLNLTSFFYQFGGESLSAARFGLSLVASTIIPAYYLLGCQLHSRQLGLVLALLGAFDNLFFHLSHQLIGDAAAVALLIGSLYFILREWNLVGGIVLAVALQLKPVMLPLLPLFPLWIMTRAGTIGWRWRHWRWRAGGSWLGGFALCMILTLWWFGWFTGGGLHQFQGGSFAAGSSAAIGIPNISLLEKLTLFLNHCGYGSWGNLFLVPLFFAAFFWLGRKQKAEARVVGSALLLLLVAFAKHKNINWYHYTIFVPLLIYPLARFYVEASARRAVVFALGFLLLINFSLDLRPWYWPDYSEDAAHARRGQVIAILRRQTTPDAWIISDDPFPVAAAGRFTSPALVDISWARVRFHSVTCDSLTPYLKDPRVQAVVVTKIFSLIDCGESEWIERIKKEFPHAALELPKAQVFLR